MVRRLRGAFLMGVTWALAWGGGVGGSIELLSNLGIQLPITHLADIWPLVLGIPGFLCGAAFSVALGVAAHERRFDELSLGNFAALGAVGGAVGGALMMLLGFGPLILVPLLLLGTASAAGTLAVARRAATPALPEAPTSGPLL